MPYVAVLNGPRRHAPGRVKAQITFVAAPPGPSVREHDDSPLWFSIRQRVMYVQVIQALVVLFRFPIRDVD
jgi:hypothetical protein